MTTDPQLFWHEAAAASYDSDPGGRNDPAALAVESALLAELAGGGGALELAIGTGRVAVPLARRGVRVAGIELSEPMLAQLRAKPEAAGMELVVGDMRSATVPGAFDLVYLVFNTIGNVTTQDAQLEVFGNAARHLRPGGRFLVEVGVPGVLGLAPGERFRVFTHTGSRTGIDEYDVVTQQMWSHHAVRQPDGSWRHSSPPFRYAWPAELDLMARIAGLELEHRWGWYDRSPFTAYSTAHVSVWRRPA